MKKITKILLVPGIVIGTIIIGLFIGINSYIMPSIVEANELILPNVVGLNKNEAIKIMDKLNLTPIVVGPSYDARYKVDEVIFQKPHAGTNVKENRRVYIHICGGEPIIKMPQLVGKTYRDASVNLERNGLFIKSIEEVRSELPVGTVVDQSYPSESELEKGDSVKLKVSIGAKIGMVRAPNIIAKSEKEAEKILHRLSLRLGSKSYIASPTLLPNTIISQSPSEDDLLNIGDSVNVVISKSDR
ncbi:MAG: PASTA domain-containing protein [Bacteroidetes bacterium]|nr:PASTA domain-containing protein [Bacteroidota bacterium]